jgi:hypothetical protein
VKCRKKYSADVGFERENCGPFGNGSGRKKEERDVCAVAGLLNFVHSRALSHH